jgi:UDP-N-acetylmuramyl pentapeptide phosphotransferase/UDP-N-acetylglucosamine-1-phosphate transferase
MRNDVAHIWIVGIATAVLATLISVALILALRPWLLRYAPARPNARSSHTLPTPQGGGIAVVAATIIASCACLYLAAPAVPMAAPLLALFAAIILITCIGAIDDIRPLPIGPRLLLQGIIVGGVIYSLPDDFRVAPSLPRWIERPVLVIGGLWFINLVNFMDGLDWMTVAETLPITVTVALIGGLGLLPMQDVALALALCGAMIGFAYFNRPVAKLFLGDVGSLPIGLLLGWLLLSVAAGGHLAAAVLMLLYYVADATVTLLRRLAGGEPVWQAHRKHFYQLATDRGFKVIEVVACVFFVNIGLCALAALTVTQPGRPAEIASLPAGALLVAGLLFVFARGKDRKGDNKT